MATKGSSFTAIPNIPQSGLTDWQFNTLTSMKENLELLMGARRSAGTNTKALLSGQVTVANPPAQVMTAISSTGAGFLISNRRVASLEDYTQALRDLQTLADDVANLRATVNTLVNQLKG